MNLKNDTALHYRILLGNYQSIIILNICWKDSTTIKLQDRLDNFNSYQNIPPILNTLNEQITQYLIHNHGLLNMVKMLLKKQAKHRALKKLQKSTSRNFKQFPVPSEMKDLWVDTSVSSTKPYIQQIFH